MGQRKTKESDQKELKWTPEDLQMHIKDMNTL